MINKWLIVIYISFYLFKGFLYFSKFDTYTRLDIGKGSAFLFYTSSHKVVFFDASSSYEADGYLFDQMPFDCLISSVVIPAINSRILEALRRIKLRCLFGTVYTNKIPEGVIDLNYKILPTGTEFSFDGIKFKLLASKVLLVNSDSYNFILVGNPKLLNSSILQEYQAQIIPYKDY
ncbi:MAG TPA: hypothetical protein VLI92_00235 [Candidatus Saccharimonadales bacterium]|nr:hypothetical protein [Candidatus Saccharimonadales bacterium]